MMTPFAENEEGVNPGYPQTVVHLESVDSTNQWAIDHSLEYTAEQLPLLVVADRQTQGRGRSGRSWYADDGTLTFSILDSIQRLRVSRAHLPRLALAAGLSVAEAIDSLVPPIAARLKWPNDVYVSGGKVAGLLVESVANSLDRVVIGIGVNVATDLSQAPLEVQQRARSLTHVANRPLAPQDLLLELLERLRANTAEVGDNFGALVKQLRNRCCLTGHAITLQQGGHVIAGHCLGIDDHGALRLQTAEQILAIQSGEIVRFG